ncbi:MAG: type I-F CRISPR-associated endoribonuclease Cas6/Csy4 [Pseudomarimonas sp.]
MTTHYLDLIVVPDAEHSAAHLLGALYDKFHRALVRASVSDIGVSFPGHRTSPLGIGNHLRLHGSEAGIRQLMASDWMKGLRDHVGVGDVKPVPLDATHRTVQRKQFKTNVERLRRRRMKRKGETVEQAQAAIPSSVARDPKLPYVHLRSLSTGQPFCLFIALGNPQAQPVGAPFNSYGLGGPATVPWF